MNQNARRFSISCFKQRFSQLSDVELAQKLALACLGDNNFPGLTSTQNQMNWIQDSIALAEKLHPIFESLNILYYITRGVAAIGFATAPKRNRLRGSSDNSRVDIVIFIHPADIIVLATELEQMGFYVPGVALG